MQEANDESSPNKTHAAVDTDEVAEQTGITFSVPAIHINLLVIGIKSWPDQHEPSGSCEIDIRN
jgi:hypothetical protein